MWMYVELGQEIRFAKHLAKQDPGRARYNSLTGAGTNFVRGPADWSKLCPNIHSRAQLMWLTNACKARVHLPHSFPLPIHARIQSNRRRSCAHVTSPVRDIFLFPSVPTTLRSSDKKYRMEGKGWRAPGRERRRRRGGSI